MISKKKKIIIVAIIIFIILLWSIINLIHGVQTIDTDGDGLSNEQEEKIGTDTMEQDSDDDGINDFEEYNFWNSLSEKYSNESYLPTGDIKEESDKDINILDKDSDNDGISDGDEIDYWNKRYEEEGIESLKPDGDIDNDGIPNILDWDSDNDKASDGYEINPEGLNTDPSDPDTDGDGKLDGEDLDADGPQNNNELTYGGSSLYQTTGTSRNGYHTDPICITVFDPYLAGRKRLEVYDAIREDYEAYIYDKSLSKIELTITKYENEFTGIINLDLSSNYIRIPSVAPKARIHSYNVDPNMGISFYKDGADNYYIKSTRTYGDAELTFTTSADSSYYTYYIPEYLTLDDIKEEKITPPYSVRKKADIVIEKLGLTGEKNLKKIVNTLYDYFSSFTPGDIPSKEEEPDDYLAMALYQHGCCYVRSFACFVTANSIGIPTRLIKNECHSFVEMYIPDEGWMEVQLGGCGGGISNENEYDPFSEGYFPGDGDGVGDGDGTWPWENGEMNWECAPDLINTNTTISYVSPNSELFEYFNVVGYTKDEKQIGIPNMEVLIYITLDKNIPGILCKRGQTDSYGRFDLTCKVPSEVIVGKNHVIAHSISNDVYCGSWSDPIINISSDTTLTLDMVESVGYQGYLTVEGFLYDSGNKPLSNKEIYINKNAFFQGSTYTNSKGEFYHSIYINSLESFTIDADFFGDTYLNPSHDSQDVIVRDTRTNLQMYVDSENIIRGKQINVNGSLITGSNTGLPNSQIQIIYAGKKITTTSTDSQGLFEISITIPANSDLSYNILKAKYPGTELFAEAQDKKYLFVQAETQLTITSPSKKNIEQNETIQISGTLKDNLGQPLENKVINIDWDFFNDDIYIDSEGSFSIPYKISSTEKLGLTKLIINFDGDNYYLSSQDSKDLQIVPLGYVEEQKKQDESQNIYWLIIIAVIISVLIIGGIIMIRKQRNIDGPSIHEIASHTIDKLKNEGDHRKTVMKCYKEMCNWLSRQGVNKGSFQTPREFAMATKNFLKISPEGLYTLTQIFEKARYSKHQINTEDRDKAIKCLNEIISNPINIPSPQQSPGQPVGNYNR